MAVIVKSGGGGIKVLVDGEKLKAKELALGVDFNMRTESPTNMTQPPRADNGIYATFKNKLYKIGDVSDEFNKDVYKTEDLITWTKIRNLPFSANQNFLGFEFDNKFHIVGIYAYKKQAHWVTDDFETWTKLKDIPFKIDSNLAYVVVNKGVLHIFNNIYPDVGKHYISNDGINFIEGELLPIKPSQEYVVASVNNEMLLLSDDAKMRKSVDGGKVWSDLPNTPFKVNSILTANVNINETFYILSVLNQSEGVWKMNEDYSWTKKNDAPNVGSISARNVLSLNDNMYILVYNPTYIYQPAIDQWTGQVGGLPFDFYNGISIDKSKYPTIVGGTPNKKAMTYYTGLEWILEELLPFEVEKGYGIDINEERHIFSAVDNSHWVRSNGIWSKLTNAPFKTTCGTLFKGEIYIFFEGHGYKYNINNDTYSAISDFPSTGSPTNVVFSDENFIYLIGDRESPNKDVYVSKFNGTSWTYRKTTPQYYLSDSPYCIFQGRRFIIENYFYEVNDDASVTLLSNTTQYPRPDYRKLGVAISTETQILNCGGSSSQRTFAQTQFKLDHILY